MRGERPIPRRARTAIRTPQRPAPIPFVAANRYTDAMNDTLPRPVLYVGVPLLAIAAAVAVWAWVWFGAGVWFDTVASGFSACL